MNMYICLSLLVFAWISNGMNRIVLNRGALKQMVFSPNVSTSNVLNRVALNANVLKQRCPFQVFEFKCAGSICFESKCFETRSAQSKCSEFICSS